MPDQRVIPNPTLARAEIDARLRARGYVPSDDEPRTHLRYRRTIWRHPDGNTATLCEAHVVGERYMNVSAEAPDDLLSALEAVPRAALLHAADAAPDPRRALPWLRRLCLLEHDVLSPELREHLTRVLTHPDLLVRSAAIAAALGLTREHVVWALERVAEAETNATLRTTYKRTARAERGKLTRAPRPAAARRKPAKTTKKS
jgi:hypothetical protein